jgi:hypothetical protein
LGNEPRKILNATFNDTTASTSLEFSLETPMNTVEFYDKTTFKTTGILNWLTGFPNKQRHCYSLTDLRIIAVADGYTHTSEPFTIKLNDLPSKYYQFFVLPDQKQLVFVKDDPNSNQVTIDLPERKCCSARGKHSLEYFEAKHLSLYDL